MKYFLRKKAIAIGVLIFFILFITAEFEIAGIYLTLMVMIYIFMLYFPKISQKHKYDDLNFELPYALRHMATELKAGKDCMIHCLLYLWQITDLFQGSLKEF